MQDRKKPEWFKGVIAGGSSDKSEQHAVPDQAPYAQRTFTGTSWHFDNYGEGIKRVYINEISGDRDPQISIFVDEGVDFNDVMKALAKVIAELNTCHGL